LLRQFRLIRQSREERAVARIVALRSNRNDGRRRQPIVISIGIVLLAAVVLVTAGLVAVPLWAVLMQSWRFEPIADQCKMLKDPRAREACDQMVRIEEAHHPARGAKAPITRAPERRTD
jgi:hypothetical protein